MPTKSNLLETSRFNFVDMEATRDSSQWELGSLSLLSHFLRFNFVDISATKETWLDKGVAEKNWNLFSPMKNSLRPISGKNFDVIGFQSMLNSPKIFAWHENFYFNEEPVSKQSIY